MSSPISTNNSSTSPASDYDTLISLLHPAHQILEIEILPSSHSSSILSAPPSIGIPKRILLACFLHARKIFHTTANESSSEETRTTGQDKIWKATKVLTLWEPNWSSAWAFRRRYLLALPHDDEVVAPKKRGEKRIKDAIVEELAWVETLVTSPLDGKHAKSSWVWAHRLWIMRSFWREVLEGCGDDEGGDVGELLRTELKIVMVAGERHARNYYAWEYAREAMRMCIRNKRSGRGVVGANIGEKGVDMTVWRECTTMVHRWCLMHPRDISGWTFLAFIMDQRVCFMEPSQAEAVTTDDILRGIFEKTRRFVNQFNWKGESIEWFLKSASYFHTESND
ncbi:MAG: hypothetical protein Q9209_003965 [Squamulea sp. 1 TL-2023]